MRLRSSKLRFAQGFTLVEAMMALAAVGFVATAIIYSLLTLNRHATRQRDMTSAKALCQERIEETLSVPYDPANATIPAILVTGTTTTDTVKVYVKQDNTTVTVPGTRTVVVATADATLKLLQITVKVAYTFQSKAFAYQMATLRAPD